MGAENIYYEVPLTSTSAEFATSISASATAYADAGGAYNMKCVGSWFAYSALYRIAVGMPYLYGQDEILFGMNYSMKATQLSYHLAEIESVLNVLNTVLPPGLKVVIEAIAISSLKLPEVSRVLAKKVKAPKESIGADFLDTPAATVKKS